MNPATMVATKYIGRAGKRTRALSPSEIRMFLRTVDQADINRQFKLALRIILLTLVRKSELLQARSGACESRGRRVADSRGEHQDGPAAPGLHQHPGGGDGPRIGDIRCGSSWCCQAGVACAGRFTKTH